MDAPNIKIVYQDTPEKFRNAANEAVAFLVENLRKLNAIHVKYILLDHKVEDFERRGIRIKDLPKTRVEVWKPFKEEYSKIASTFCTEELHARGFGRSTGVVTKIIEPDGTVIEGEALKERNLLGKYFYLDHGCELTITMKSARRAVAEIFYKGYGSIDTWERFTLVRLDDHWWIKDMKRKTAQAVKWSSLCWI